MTNLLKYLPALTLAAFATAASAQTSVVGSPHDLSPTGGNVVNAGATQGAQYTAQGQVCTYCHAPHNAGNVGAPLWNRSNSTIVFKMYSSANSSTFQLANGDVNTAARPVGPVSLACLSCHDGVTAFNSLNNAPMFDTDALATNSNPAYLFTLGTGGKAVANMADAAAGVLVNSVNVGTDLTNDHPISFTYNTTLATLKGTTLRDPATALATNLVIYRAGAAAGGAAQNIATQMLFTKAGAALPDQLECASCHEPHMHGTSGTATESAATGAFPFLIKSNAGSQLCLTCHNK